MTKRKKIIYNLISLGLFFIAWQLYITCFQVPSFILPSLFDSLKELAYQFTQLSFYMHVAYTCLEIFIGFSCAVALGSVLGYVIYKHKHTRELFMPILVFFQVAPKIALIPMFIIWFGLGFSSKILIVLIMSFFPVIEGVINGMQSITKNQYDLMRILKANKKQVLMKLEIPSCMPAFFAALKVGVTQAIIGATVAEWMAGQNGIGYLQTFASSSFNSPLLVAGIIVTILLGILLYFGIDVLENRISYRHAEVGK